jgi:hypothetical protein
VQQALAPGLYDCFDNEITNDRDDEKEYYAWQTFNRNFSLRRPTDAHSPSPGLAVFTLPGKAPVPSGLHRKAVERLQVDCGYHSLDRYYCKLPALGELIVTVPGRGPRHHDRTKPRSAGRLNDEST